MYTKVVAGAKNHQAVRSTGSQGKAHCPLKFPQAVYKVDQGVGSRIQGYATPMA